MMRRLVLFSILLVCNPIRAADNYSYVCSHDGNERRIEVVYLSEDKRVPCEVRYIKDSAAKVLWNARQQEGFCESKAESFAEKQKSWGWSCNRSDESDGASSGGASSSGTDS
jgi:hypothetical protein|tara:strand:+ start:341 stop:676 length:336 start_codon:yes stop_codon:yes gene_type:complete